MALTARERQILAGGAASAASEVTGASLRPPGTSIRPYILPPAGPGGTVLPPGGGLPPIQQAGFPLIPLAIAAAAKLLPKALPYIAGIVGGVGLAGAMGDGNGAREIEGTGAQYGVPFGGPGLKEPGGKYLLKEWKIRMDSKEGDFNLQFYLTINDRGTKRIFMYNQRTKGWKTWPMPRLAVIGKNMPSHQMITRLRRNLKRHTADAVTILKLTSPGKLESTRRPGGKWVKGRKRYID